MQKRNNWFVNYHKSESKNGLRDLDYRKDFYDITDIKNKSVLDIGCNAGQMCKFALDNSASYVYGIEFDVNAVKEARKILHDYNNCSIICDDIDNYFTFTSIPNVDTTFFLSVVDTQELQNKYGIVSRLSSITKNVMYYEGHHTSSYDKLIHNIIKYTDFKNIEYYGKTFDNIKDVKGRDFFKLSKKSLEYESSIQKIIELLGNQNINTIAVCGFSGSGKSYLRKKLCEYIKNTGVKISKIFQDSKNENCVIYETPTCYILDDISKIPDTINTAKKIILFDYNAINIIKTPDCILYLMSDIKRRLNTTEEPYVNHRNKQITYYNFKYLYHINPRDS